jgi:hypothetical protein
MTLHPGILALYVSSALVTGMVLYAAYHAATILRHWDLASGSELQLSLERRTYLLSTLLAYAFAFQLASLFVLVFTADSLCLQFVGAMCAAGTFQVNAFGYPTLLVKVASFLLAGTWLVLNHADNRAHDYPLTRRKYALLLVLVPLVVAESVLQALFFFGLDPDVITSCCGTLFGAGARGLGADLASLPLGPTRAAFFVWMTAILVAGAFFVRRGRGALLFALLSGTGFLVGAAALLSFISVYFYELPTHHCPFCLLKKEYGYVGYPLYLSLLGGGVFGLGVGVLEPFRQVPSLSEIVPNLQRRLTVGGCLCFFVLTVIPAVRILATDFRP